MRPDFQPTRSRRLCRLWHVAGALIVFLSFFFNVLDLDGSKIPAPIDPVEKSVLAAEETPDLDPIQRVGRAELWEDNLLVADRTRECARRRNSETLRSTPLDLARSHGYRVGLPRDPIADLSLPV
ncbi:MAG TPA: hypothetical protein VGL11_04465 [Candidatus Binatia bacterium]|jgi:hypothetical protein